MEKTMATKVISQLKSIFFQKLVSMPKYSGTADCISMIKACSPETSVKVLILAIGLMFQTLQNSKLQKLKFRAQKIQIPH